MIEIKSLSRLSIQELYQAFEDAFADYEIQLSQDELETMLVRRGFVSELTFGAFYNTGIVGYCIF